MKKLIPVFLSVLILLISSVKTFAAPNVVVSIKPIHSLVSGVMEGVATPQLIVKKGSPHGYTLRPSEAKMLAKADLVVWVGHELESFLDKPLKTLSNEAEKLTLSESLASLMLQKRDGGNWEKHKHHDDDEHKDHDEHEHHADEHKDHDEHEHHVDEHKDHDEHEHHDHEHENHDEHAKSIDSHIWLDPKIAKEIVVETTKKLVEMDPQNASKYNENSLKLIQKLVALDKSLEKKLAPVKNKPYIVFHAAYQYFEVAYGLNGVGSVTIEPDRKPGAKTISDIRSKVKELKAVCVFSEPQFESSIVKTIIDGTGAKTGVLDPLGSNIDAGSNAYFILMNNLADDLLKGLL